MAGPERGPGGYARGVGVTESDAGKRKGVAEMDDVKEMVGEGEEVKETVGEGEGEREEAEVKVAVLENEGV